jgi:Family of unknown function (DUF6193)
MSGTHSPDPFAAEWDQLLGKYSQPDPPNDWLHPVFRSLVVAAYDRQELRRYFPYQALNQLAFSTVDTFPFDTHRPAVGVGSLGIYAVVNRPGLGGEILTETVDPVEAGQHVVQLLQAQ